jgi:hypothetical protein
VAGLIIRDATGSWAGHAIGNIGDGKVISGQPPKAVVLPAEQFNDALWFYRMWDQLMAEEGWTKEQVAASQTTVTARWKQEEGCNYDWEAYPAFAAEVFHIRTSQQLAPWFKPDKARVCSAIIADGLMKGGVPLDFVPEDGPGIIGGKGSVALPPNLIAPGMLLGLAQRKGWL